MISLGSMSQDDNRPQAVEWEDEFGESQWNDKSVDDKMAKTSLLVLQNAMKGRKVLDTQRKSAEFVAAHKAWPMLRGDTVNINVLRLEDIEQAKIKAGLSPRVIEGSQSKPSEALPPAEDPPKPAK